MSANDDADPCFAGGGECGALMRSIRWSETPLGPSREWPRTLRTLVTMMLASRFAMRILWGPEFILLYNDAYRPVLGPRKHPAAMGQPIEESYKELWATVGPMFERVLQGEAVALDDGLLPIVRNDYLEESYFTLSYSPIVDEEGVRGVLGVVHETTERVLAERRFIALRHLASNLAHADTMEGIFHCAGDALLRHGTDVPFIVFYDLPDGANEARRVHACGLENHPGAAPETIRLDAARATWPLDLAAEGGVPLAVLDVARRFGAVHAGPFPEPITSAIILPLVRKGDLRPRAFVACGVNPRRALDDKYRAFFELLGEQVAAAMFNVLARIEERRTAEELARQKDALESALRLKDEFVATMSHELRTPLNAILGWTRMMKMGRVAAPRIAHALETVERNAVAQVALVDDLLDVSRILTGKLRLQVEPIDLAAVVDAVVDTLRPAAEGRGIQLRTTLDRKAGCVSGDPDRLSQMVTNLVSNAIKFTPKGGRVNVQLERSDAKVRLVVTDNGEGIAPEFLPLVFDRFRQADQTITRRHGGLGLGLSIVKHLVELHGGTVEARSDGPGRGATFVLSLPRASVPVVVIPTREEPQGDPSERLVGLRVLVVDDESDTRDLLSAILSYAGISVRTAEDASGAMREIGTHVPDVLVCDIGMPEIDGYALMRRLRTLPAHAGGSVKAVAVTAYARPEDRRHALAAGFDLHLAKPVDPSELLASIARLVGRVAPAR